MSLLAIRRFLKLPLELLDIFARLYTYILGCLKPGLYYLWNQVQLDRIQSCREHIDYKTKKGKAVRLLFAVPNQMCSFRIRSFAQKEPETLEWIEEFGHLGPMFDVGANIGLYSCFAASLHRQPVYAFEPSVFNLSLLSENINLNGLQPLVHLVATPLSEGCEIAEFSLTNTELGGALSAFGVDYGYDGKPLKKAFSYKTIGFSLDKLMEIQTQLPRPALVKIDVDGIEHLILEGARKTLSDPACRTVLIEVNDQFKDQAENVEKIMLSCGFVLSQKKHSEWIANSKAFSNTYNQIWIKST